MATGCDAGSTANPDVVQRPLEAIDDSTFAGLVERVSEEGGFFDTDNLISNESGYLKVMGALEDSGLRGGGYVGVGPDQNFSYIAVLRPEIAFITDVRRDNMLHHLLLKALMERAATRVEFLAGLHGRSPPVDPLAWRSRPIDDIAVWIDGEAPDANVLAALHIEIAGAVQSYGIPLTPGDLATIRRFHQTFVDSGMGLRFTSFGRAPRPYYPTYRQLVLETDLSGERSSYLATAESYGVVRDLHLANRIIPVVGDMAGSHAVQEMGEVMREMGTELAAFYTSNVEFYLWRNRTFGRWRDNLGGLPLTEGAVIIRSYFPNFGGLHPSAVPGYFATQTLQPVEALLEGGFATYWELVTHRVVELR
jgi:hypothetical protein